MILALQFYEGDQTKALTLARLLADVEPAYRSDVVLGLVCQPDTPDCEQISDTVSYCSVKFNTIYVKSARGGKGWQDGSGELWCGTMEHFSNNDRGSSSIFTFDGGDGVPLHKNWIDLAKSEHKKTTSQKKLVSATFSHDAVNGNMIAELDLWKLHLSTVPLKLLSKEGFCEIWESQFKNVIIPLSRLSNFVRNEWNSLNITRQGLIDRSQSYVWLHGYKDVDLVNKARSFLIK